MSNLYLDFENINTNTEDIRAEAYLNLQQTIPTNNFNKVSIAKIILDVSDNSFYFARVPLANPQMIYSVNQDIPEYAGITDDDNKKFNQANGYYITNYRMTLCYKSNNTLKIEEFPLLFKSNETKFNYNDIGLKTTSTPNLYYVDNFNKYFISHSPNNLLSSFNDCIRYILTKKLNITNPQYSHLLPKFYTDDKKLIVNNFSFGLNNDLQPDNTSEVLQVETPDQVNSFTYPGSSHSSQDLFCIGFNKLFKNIFYHSLVSKEYTSDDLKTLDNTFTGDENYYFLNLNQILDVSLSIPDSTTPTTKYNISSQYVNEFYDFQDLQVIEICGDFPVQPLYRVSKNKDYILSMNNENKMDTMAQNVLFKLSISANSLAPTQFQFQQPSITNNYSTMTNLNNTNYHIYVNYIDRYGNVYDATLSYGQRLYLSLCAFN